MSHVSPKFNSAPARLLAVVALLLLLGAQVLETTHYHSSGEPVSSCVHCHGTTGAALPANVAGITLDAAATVWQFFFHPQLRNTAVRAGFNPRAPPTNS